MSQAQIDALDRELDSLRAGQDDPSRDADDLLARLARIPAAQWPDRAAGQRVGVQVAAALGLDRPAERPPVVLARPGPSASRDDRTPARPRLQPGSRLRPGSGRRTRTAVLAAAALLTTAAATLIAASQDPGGPQLRPQPLVFHSRFTATIIAAGARTAPAAPHARTWQLVSYLTGAGWQAGKIGASTGDLSCPNVEVCYLSAARPVPISGYDLPSPTYNILEVTRDGGASWTALSLPADVSISTPLQCPESATTCFAAGRDAHRNVLFFTTDGGQSWSARPTPAPGDAAAELACPTDSKCVALFQAPGWAPGYVDHAYNAVVMATSDGGRHWSAGPPAPHGQLPDYLTCGGSTCVLFDQLITEDNSQSVNGIGPQTIAPGSWAAWYSHDDGMTWQRGQHPASIWTTASSDLPNPGTISCSDRLHCWAAMSNQIGQSGIATAFLATTNGGVSWSAQQLPVQRARQFFPLAMSCPTARQCYVGGGDTSGPVILTTTNGGATWSPVSLPATHVGNANRTGLLPDAGALSCAAATHCVATLLSNGSAHSVPVYSLGAWQS
jgi:photosystem II stability/assembly factor-like uncharacterized protein